MDEKDTYSVLVVDPPWSYGSDTGRTRTAEFHYDTLGNNGKEVNRKTGAGIESIIRVTPVIDLATPDAHLYMWTTNPKLPFSFEIVKAWGFEYKTTLTWVKTTRKGDLHRGGMGWFFRGATEHIIFAVKGHKPIPSAIRKPNVMLATPTEHSEKPTAFYDLVRSLYPTEEKMIDIYGRRKHDRFDSWGNEAEENNVYQARTEEDLSNGV